MSASDVIYVKLRIGYHPTNFRDGPNTNWLFHNILLQKYPAVHYADVLLLGAHFTVQAKL
jgi:hypothetical protein